MRNTRDPFHRILHQQRDGPGAGAYWSDLVAWWEVRDKCKAITWIGALSKHTVFQNYVMGEQRKIWSRSHECIPGILVTRLLWVSKDLMGIVCWHQCSSVGLWFSIQSLHWTSSFELEMMISDIYCNNVHLKAMANELHCPIHGAYDNQTVN